jgi:predicted phage tail protein
MYQNSEPGYKVFTGNENVTLNDLYRQTQQSIKIVPVVSGSGKGPLQIILGAALMFFAPQLAVSLMPYGAVGAIALTTQVLSSIGFALLLQGVGEVFFKPPRTEGPTEAPENMPSDIFNGPVNTIRQGNPVPVCYGRLIVGSQVISAGLFAERVL